MNCTTLFTCAPRVRGAKTTFFNFHPSIILAIFFGVISFLPAVTFCANINWTNGNSTLLWTDPGNWDGGNVPGVNDIAVFNGTSTDDCVIASNVSVAGVLIEASYTGIISQVNSASEKLTVGTSGISMSGGTFNPANIELSGDLTISGGTFSHSSGKVVFKNNDFNTTITGNLTFNDLEFAPIGSVSRSYTISAITVNGALTLSGESQLKINSGTLAAKGDINLLNYNTSTGGTGTLLINGTVDQTLTQSGSANFPMGLSPSVEINKPSGNLILATDWLLSGNNFTFTHTAGSFGGSGKLVFILCTVSQVAGQAINANVDIGTTDYNANPTITIPTGETVNIIGDFAYAAIGNIIRINGGTLALQGNLNIQNSGNELSTAELLINGTGNQTVTATTTSGHGKMPDLEINKPSGNLILATDWQIYNDFEHADGGFSGSGKLIFRNNPSAMLSQASGQMLPDVEFASALVSIPSSETVTIGGDASFSGTSSISTGTLALQGNITLLASSGGNASILINGSNVQTISASNDFAFTNSIIEIDKSGGSFSLATNWLLKREFKLTNGVVVLSDNDLSTYNHDGFFTGGGTSSYILTSGSGVLKQRLNSTNTTTSNSTKNFPVGYSSYNPIVIQNNSTGSSFVTISARVEDQVLTNGNSGTAVASDVVTRTWHLDDATSTASSYVLTPNWTSSEEANGFDRNNCFVSHYTGSGWDDDNPGPATNSGGFFSISRANVTSMSPFAVVNGEALPIELIGFEARLEKKEVKLSWETASETNNEGFEIQRSTDGENWEEIGFVPGAGISTARNSYRFRDENPVSGINYYRLRQLDFDGGFSFSKVVSVESQFHQLIVYPNPVIDYIQVIQHESEGDSSIEIYNQFGRLMFSKKLELETTMVDISALPKGTYLLKGKINNDISVKKLIKL